MIGLELGPLVPIGRHHAEHAVVEIDLVLLVHHAHVIGAMGVGVGEDQVDIVRVLEHDLFENPQREAREVHGFAGHFAEARRVFGGERLGHAAGQSEYRVGGLARGQHHQLAQLAPHGNHFLPGLDAHFGDDAQHVAFGGRSLRPDHEIRASQEVEVQRVVLHEERGVDQLAYLPGGGRRRHLVERIQRLGRRHVMGRGADAANARRDLRHVLRRAALRELFESAQLGHLEIGALHHSLPVQEDLDLAVAFRRATPPPAIRRRHRPSGGCQAR